MSIKKYSSGQWVDIPYRKYGTETDTLTSLPADIIGDGQSATANIIGNMNQQGTPSPSSIIMPDECGDKTANLLEYYIDALIYADGSIVTSQSYQVYCAPVIAGETYTLGNTIDVYGFYSSKPALNSVANDGTRHFYSSTVGGVITIPEGTTWLGCRVATGVNAMLNTGSTALPYQPYGYKIPILSGNTTTNWYTSEPLRKLTYIYNGKPETALDTKSNTTENRNICKLELTGQEDWGISGGVFWLGTLTTDYMRKYNSANYICSHYPCYQQTGSAGNVPDMQIAMGYNSAVQRIYLHDSNYTTVQDFQAYLAQQYAAGTPVTLWYVKATGTTEQVAAPSIPTTGTAESFDISTTLKPSEVSLTYHGWHEHSDTKFTG